MWSVVSASFLCADISLLDSFCFLGADGTFATVTFPSRRGFRKRSIEYRFYDTKSECSYQITCL